MKYQGSCHCGKIQFEVEAPEALECLECNCSICSKLGYLHLVVPQSRFRLLSGEDAIATYTWNTGVAKHTFCKYCGVKPFYVPRSNPDGYSVNVRSLDPWPENLIIKKFDGQNWEQNAGKISHLSNE